MLLYVMIVLRYRPILILLH